MLRESAPNSGRRGWEEEEAVGPRKDGGPLRVLLVLAALPEPTFVIRGKAGAERDEF